MLKYQRIPRCLVLGLRALRMGGICGSFIFAIGLAAVLHSAPHMRVRAPFLHSGGMLRLRLCIPRDCISSSAIARSRLSSDIFCAFSFNPLFSLSRRSVALYACETISVKFLDLAICLSGSGPIDAFRAAASTISYFLRTNGVCGVRLITYSATGMTNALQSWIGHRALRFFLFTSIDTRFRSWSCSFANRFYIPAPVIPASVIVTPRYWNSWTFRSVSPAKMGLASRPLSGCKMRHLVVLQVMPWSAAHTDDVSSISCNTSGDSALSFTSSASIIRARSPFRYGVQRLSA